MQEETGLPKAEDEQEQTGEATRLIPAEMIFEIVEEILKYDMKAQFLSAIADRNFRLAVPDELNNLTLAFLKGFGQNDSRDPSLFRVVDKDRCDC